MSINAEPMPIAEVSADDVAQVDRFCNPKDNPILHRLLAKAFRDHRLTALADAERKLDEIGDHIAERVGEKVLAEFKGFWEASEIAEELPGMIREAAAAFLAAQDGDNK